MTFNKNENGFDSVLLGIALSLGLAIGLLILIFKTRYQTEMPLFEAIWNLSKKGLLTKDLLASSLPGLALIFIFSKLGKEKATIGAFVGVVPSIILTFWFL